MVGFVAGRFHSHESTSQCPVHSLASKISLLPSQLSCEHQDDQLGHAAVGELLVSGLGEDNLCMNSKVSSLKLPTEEATSN